MQPRSKAGILFFIGSVQFLILMIVAETQYSGYSPANNYISDLGVWNHDSAFIFNLSVILFGVFGAIGGYTLLKGTDLKWISIFLLLSGIGAMGVGTFNKDVEGVHLAVSAMAFGFAAFAAISSYWYLPTAIGVPGMVLGAIGLTAMCLVGTDMFIGLGPGGMERMVLYPVLGWMLLFNGYLLGSDGQMMEKMKGV